LPKEGVTKKGEKGRKGKGKITKKKLEFKGLSKKICVLAQRGPPSDREREKKKNLVQSEPAV